MLEAVSADVGKPQFRFGVSHVWIHLIDVVHWAFISLKLVEATVIIKIDKFRAKTAEQVTAMRARSRVKVALRRAHIARP
jgi:hypothetical protein